MAFRFRCSSFLAPIFVWAGVEYPVVLFVTGDADTRVDPLHARKMAALLQRDTASGPKKPVLLHYDTHAGHSGGRPLSKRIEELTDETAFLFWQLGVQDGRAPTDHDV